MTDGTFSYSQALARSLRLCFAHPVLFFGLAFWASFLPICVTIAGEFFPNLASGVALMFLPVSIGNYVLFQMAMIEGVDRVTRCEPVSIKALLLSNWDRIWRGWCAYLLYILIIAAGILLLLIPAFYWGTIFAFFLFVLVLEEERPWASFRRSHELVKGRFMTVLKAHGCVFLATILLLAPILLGLNILWAPVFLRKLITSVLAVVVLPVFVSFYYQLLVHLRRLKDGRLKIHEILVPRPTP